jgi:signal transduction histidine kinase
LLACLLVAGDLRHPGNASTRALTTIGAIKASLDAPERQTTVDVRAVATFFDADAGVIYLQDRSAAIALRVGNPGSAIASGTTVGLTGEMKTGTKLPVVERAQITALELAASLPEARPVSVASLLEGQARAEWVTLRGVVRAVVRREDSLLLEIQDKGRRIHVATPRDVDDPCLLGSRVLLEGVSTAAFNTGPHGEHVLLVVPDSFHLRIEEAPPLDAFELPLLSLEEVFRDPLVPDKRVRVRGSVARRLGDTAFELAAGERRCSVSLEAPSRLTQGASVDLVGFAFRQNGDCAFESSRVRSTARVAAEEAPLPLISGVRDLRMLKNADARRGYPIHLMGVVTCCGPGRALFIDDGSAGTYIESRRHFQTTRPGDRVEVTGISAGDFVPIVDHPRVRTLGHGPLPLPRALGPEQLVAGEEDGQWVSVEGIVRSVTERRYFAEIYVSTGGFVRFPVEVPLDEVSAARELIDARVRVRGVRGSRFNSGRQLAEVALVTSGLEMVTVLKPPPRLSSIPLLPVRALLQFVPGQRWEHQVRARGTVTYTSEGELYIRDETGGLPVRAAPSSAAVGDLVEVAGFAGAGLFGPTLEDARLLSRTPGEPVSPKFITPEQAVSGRFDGDLVQIDARILDASTSRQETRLSLQAGPFLFPAVRRGPEPGLLGLRPGSELRLTGICSVYGGRPGVPQGFQILLRTTGDVLVRRVGPWWTTRRAGWVLSAVASVAALSFVWVLALRRRVRAQSSIIWKRVKRETELQERQRMARELHDTLEQTLTGVSLTLEAASLKLATSPATAQLLLGRAIGRVGASIDEVRHVVWALRDESLDIRGLAASLRDIGRQLASCHSDSLDVDVEVEGNAHPFLVPIENNLLRIGQEALTNAVKHGKPSRIDVRLRYDQTTFSMRVSDDGLGFDMASLPPPGHFGLAGMRERAAEIGARLELTSRVNGGTEVQVTVDLGDHL